MHRNHRLIKQKEIRKGQIYMMIKKTAHSLGCIEPRLTIIAPIGSRTGEEL